MDINATDAVCLYFLLCISWYSFITDYTQQDYVHLACLFRVSHRGIICNIYVTNQSVDLCLTLYDYSIDVMAERADLWFFHLRSYSEQYHCIITFRCSVKSLRIWDYKHKGRSLYCPLLGMKENFIARALDIIVFRLPVCCMLCCCIVVNLCLSFVIFIISQSNLETELT